ncbi:Gfo/Idh/MocA family protein [Flavitalea sp.]|nr:Gfo/Idh/MocA family oxidoreductase [Flavitalea sp.]
MTKNKIRFGIIGCGRISQTHARYMHEWGELVAVCDIIKDRATTLGEVYSTRVFDNHHEMLASVPDLDLISVCTPNGLHASHSIDALKCGFHVLCEKPMALTTEDCQAMIDVSHAFDRKLFIVKQNRYNPPVVALKSLIDQGRLGKIYSLQLNCFWNRNAAYYKDTWKGSINLDGGTLFTQFSHFIDLLYWLIGDIKQAQGMTGNFGHQGLIDFEDTGVIVLQFEQGAIATINYTVNAYKKNMEGSLTIFGEKGTVKIGGQYLNELEYQEIEGFEITNLPPGNGANNYQTYQGSMSNHDKVFENIISVLNEQCEMTTTPNEGLKTVEIIRRIYSSVTNVK